MHQNLAVILRQNEVYSICPRRRRKSIYTVRQKKRTMMDKLKLEEKKTEDLTKTNQ